MLIRRVTVTVAKINPRQTVKPDGRTVVDAHLPGHIGFDDVAEGSEALPRQRDSNEPSQHDRSGPSDQTQGERVHHPESHSPEHAKPAPLPRSGRHGIHAGNPSAAPCSGSSTGQNIDWVTTDCVSDR